MPFYDHIRCKTAVKDYSQPPYGWNHMGADPETFFVKTEIQGRTWNITQCLFPIPKT
jgi:hypothetical protein